MQQQIFSIWAIISAGNLCAILPHKAKHWALFIGLARQYLRQETGEKKQQITHPNDKTSATGR